VDRYGVYTEDLKPVTARDLSDALPLRHFRAGRAEDVIGAHSTRIDEHGMCWCKRVGVDVDAHDEKADADANFRRALVVAALAHALGYRMLLTDSDGKGGFHVRVFFREEVPSEDAYALAVYLRGDGEDETFPKQPNLDGCEKKCGNWMSIPVRRPKLAPQGQEHWSRVWDFDQSCWLTGNGAIDAILACEGDPFVPAPAGQVAQRKRGPARAVNGAALPDEIEVEESRRALQYLPPEWRDDYEWWIKVGMALRELDETGHALWKEWSRPSTKVLGRRVRRQVGDVHPRRWAEAGLPVLLGQGARLRGIRAEIRHRGPEGGEQ
jgi:hypothetical protein